jgi:hydrogenase expression/formation protein HypD
MTLTHSQVYHDPRIARSLVARIVSLARKPVRLMEVCGTHTTAIFRHGIRSMLPREITLLSGPGCPVCVTDQADIDAFVDLARRPEVIVTTFGDLMRVPGSGSSLQGQKGEGADVRVIYSPLDAVELAGRTPDKEIVFLGVGFETTAPTIAAAIVTARQAGVSNFSVYAAHKTVPAALCALSAGGPLRIDGFLLPGHVSVIIGAEAYRPFFEQYRVPAVVAGFEPSDILQAVLMLVQQIAEGRPALENAYQRAVSPQGNTMARKLLGEVFESSDARWRGIGTIPGSGLALRPEFAAFDAVQRFGLVIKPVPEPKGCACGQILTGLKTPLECALFRIRCNPLNPVGPCMVSSEGTCAAYYRYGDV